MKNVKKFCATSILALTLTLSASAGDMAGPGVSETPPPPEQRLVTGDMAGPGSVTLDPVTSLTLSLLESVLSLF
ncbi:MAG TPA: hypothetical protein VJT09_17440 [Pyrinomonadaceae bacterium]|nr:hypothetical protein [Pyrinomonadaceae bacterium]